MARKRKTEINEPNSMASVSEMDPPEEESPGKKGRSTKKQSQVRTNSVAKGALAPFALLISFLMFVGLALLFFMRPTSSSLVEPQKKESLRIYLNITSSEFATEGSAAGSLDVCRGTRDFPQIDKAVIYVSDSNNKPLASIPITDASSKEDSTCKYELELKKLPTFPGAKLNIYVQFGFGASNTFLVDVGSRPPYKKVNIRLTLG
jgi:hypothetical protein